jgi:hypothetical protein
MSLVLGFSNNSPIRVFRIRGCSRSASRRISAYPPSRRVPLPGTRRLPVSAPFRRWAAFSGRISREIMTSGDICCHPGVLSGRGRGTALAAFIARAEPGSPTFGAQSGPRCAACGPIGNHMPKPSQKGPAGRQCRKAAAGTQPQASVQFGEKSRKLSCKRGRLARAYVLRKR